MEQIYQVSGMSCAGCAARVQKNVEALPGVIEAQVNLPAKLMRVECSADVEEAVVSTVRRIGFKAEIMRCAETSGNAADAEATALRRRALGSLLLVIPLAIVHICWGHAAWVHLLLTLPIVWLNRAFFVKGVRSILHGAPGMDALVSMGAGVALADGVAHLVWDAAGSVFFESAGMILAFVSIGKWLEARATQRTGQAVEKLSRLLPPTATVIRGGQEYTLPAEALQPGDEALVRPGETIPADGIVLQGQSSADESALTGESMPAEKSQGSQVYAGTLNQYGALHIKVSCERAESALSGVIRLVRDAAAQKAPVARMADRISGIFVPLVVALACGTAAAWALAGYSWDFALARAVAVLVISCPCALGLATPVAIMAGAGKGAEWGILFRSGGALECTGSVTCAALDKTGTLTRGEPCTTDILPHNISREDLLLLAATLECNANHPIAKAILRAAAGLGELLQAENLTYHPGRGVCATVQGQPCAAGNAAFMRELSVDHPDYETLRNDGKTLIHLARGGAYVGTLAVADTPRPTAAAAVQALHTLGLHTVMITGDDSRTAQAIAKQIGIDTVHADTLPQDKETIVRRLQKEGQRVAMIGDGINDAPALTRADVGIALGAGTDVAIESAGILLMHNDPLDIPRAIALSRAILHNIRQNLFFAFIYNLLAIPLAAGAFYPVTGWLLHPGIAAAAMGLSSICVVTNALRLRRFRYIPAETSK